MGESDQMIFNGPIYQRVLRGIAYSMFTGIWMFVLPCFCQFNLGE